MYSRHPRMPAADLALVRLSEIKYVSRFTLPLGYWVRRCLPLPSAFKDIPISRRLDEYAVLPFSALCYSARGKYQL